MEPENSKTQSPRVENSQIFHLNDIDNLATDYKGYL